MWHCWGLQFPSYPWSHPYAPHPSLKPSQNNRGGPCCLSLLKPPPPPSLINRLRRDPACLLYLREKGLWIERSHRVSVYVCALLCVCVCVFRKWQVFGSILSCYILVTHPCLWDYWTGQEKEECSSQAHTLTKHTAMEAFVFQYDSLWLQLQSKETPVFLIYLFIINILGLLMYHMKMDKGQYFCPPCQEL